MSRARHLLRAAAFVFALSRAAAGAENALAPENPCVTFRPGRFGEFLLESNGAPVLIQEAGGYPLQTWRDGQWREIPGRTADGRISDAIETAPGRWLAVIQKSTEEAVLEEYASGKFRHLGRLVGKFEHPTLHRAADGTVWVTSSEGAAYALKDGKTVEHAFGPPVVKGGCYTYYPPTLSLEVPGRGLWFWSHVQHEALNFGGHAKPALEGFHVYQDGAWRIVPRDGGKLGGLVLDGSGALLAGSRYEGLFRFDPATGAAENLDIPLPENEHTLFLHRNPAGHLLMVVARPSLLMRLAPMRNGWLGQLLAIRDSQIQVLLDGVDFSRDYYDKGRPAVDVPEGTFLAEPQSGLLFISADATTVRRLDWRFGVPLRHIDRMRVHGRQLFLLDRQQGFAILDYPTLLEMDESPVAENWSEHIAAAPPAVAPDGSAWFVTASVPGELRHWRGTNETSVSLEGSQFPVKSLWYLTIDSRNRPWLISNFETHRTAFLENGAGRSFDLRENAYETVAREEAGHPDFRVGTPADHCFPVFAGDGRVAYQNEWSRLCSFDGEKWDAGYQQELIDGRRPEGPPAYLDGVLTAKAGDAFYQRIDGQWRAVGSGIQWPYARDPRRKDVEGVPKGFPGDPGQISIRIRDNLGTIWMGNFDHLWRGLDDAWVPFATSNTPLRMGATVMDVQVDGSGAIWFTLGGGEYSRLARYQPPGTPPGLAWDRRPPRRTRSESLELSVRTTDAKKPLALVRFQLDDGPWRRVDGGPDALGRIHLDGLRNGPHVVRIQAFDPLLRTSDLLEHRFDVARDYARDIRRWLPILSSRDFAQREEAARQLVAIGRPALPALAVTTQKADASARWWHRAVIEEIERGP